jgi:hypothetical protein
MSFLLLIDCLLQMEFYEIWEEILESEMLRYNAELMF